MKIFDREQEEEHDSPAQNGLGNFALTAAQRAVIEARRAARRAEAKELMDDLFGGGPKSHWEMDE